MPEAAALHEFIAEKEAAMRDLGRAIIETSPFARGDAVVIEESDPAALAREEAEQQALMNLASEL